MKYRIFYVCLAAALLAACTNTERSAKNSTAPAAAAAPANRPAYPQATTTDVVDEYHGVKISDPYRWLEDPNSEETKAFVDAQNKLVREFVDGPTRDRFAARLTELLKYPRYSAPQKEGQYYFYSKNDGLQNQSVQYVTRSASDEKGARVLLDPNSWSKDGTIAMSGASYTFDGELLAYGVASGGSDQKDIRVLRVADGTRLGDELKNMKFANVAWKHDKSGFWYNRYPTPGSVPKEQEAKNNKLYWHALGTSQGDDKLLFTPADIDLSASPSVSDDGDYLLLYLNRGSTPKNRLYYRKANEPAAATSGAVGRGRRCGGVSFRVALGLAGVGRRSRHRHRQQQSPA
jgi:prolyl oligopeptidase